MSHFHREEYKIHSKIIGNCNNTEILRSSIQFWLFGLKILNLIPKPNKAGLTLWKSYGTINPNQPTYININFITVT